MNAARHAMILLVLVPILGGCKGKANWQEFQSQGYTLQARLDPDPPVVGENALRLRVLAPSGEAIEGAQVNVRAFMPAMGAMPAMDAKGSAEDSGDGNYRPTFNLSMSGNWDLTVRVEKGGADIVNFSLLVAPPRPGLSDPNAGSEAMEGNGEAFALRVPESRRQLIGVKTSSVERRALSRRVRTVGRVEIDESRLWHVTLKYSGWVEKLFVSFTNAFVRKGDPLFTLYSQELLVSQQEYLDALAAGKSGGSEALVAAARDRLRLWDLTDRQIDELAARGTATKYLTIYSPATGYVVKKEVVEGHRVEPGKRLYEIANLSSVWVIAELYEYEASLIRQGLVAFVENPYERGTRREGKVEYVYPQVDTRTRTLPVRLIFENEALALKPGMFVDVIIDVPLGEQVAVPMGAVIYSGEHRYVFVDRGGGSLEPREVLLGQRAGDDYVVLSGLEEHERVVTSGNFLISSEAQLKSALPKWQSASRDDMAMPPPAETPAAGDGSAHEHHQHEGHGQ